MFTKIKEFIRFYDELDVMNALRILEKIANEFDCMRFGKVS